MYEIPKSNDLAVLVGNVEGPLASGVFTEVAPDVAAFAVAITQDYAPSLVYVASSFLLGTLVAAHAHTDPDTFREAISDGFKGHLSESNLAAIMLAVVIEANELGEDRGEAPF